MLRAKRTHGRFEQLAQQAGLVLVYANAAPGRATDPMLEMEGEVWARSLGITSGRVAASSEDLRLPAGPGSAAAGSLTDAPYLLRWDRGEATSGGAAVRLLLLDRRSEPFAPAVPGAGAATGTFDAARESWMFLSGADGPPLNDAAVEPPNDPLVDGEEPPPPLQFRADTLHPERVTAPSPPPHR